MNPPRLARSWLSGTNTRRIGLRCRPTAELLCPSEVSDRTVLPFRVPVLLYAVEIAPLAVGALGPIPGRGGEVLGGLGEVLCHLELWWPGDCGGPEAYYASKVFRWESTERSSDSAVERDVELSEAVGCWPWYFSDSVVSWCPGFVAQSWEPRNGFFVWPVFAPLRRAVGRR